MKSQKDRQVPFIKQFSCSICCQSFSDVKDVMNHIKKGHQTDGIQLDLTKIKKERNPENTITTTFKNELDQNAEFLNSLGKLTKKRQDCQLCGKSCNDIEMHMEKFHIKGRKVVEFLP